MDDLGAVEQSIARQAMRAGEPLPDRIANAPQLILGLGLYLTAFFELDSERSHGNGLSAIPRSAIVAYADYCDFDDDQRDALVFLVRKLDNAHLSKLAKRIPSG